MKKGNDTMQHETSSTHRRLTESGRTITKLKTTGNGDSALSLVEYDDGTITIYTNGDPVQCESWDHGMRLMREENRRQNQTMNKPKKPRAHVPFNTGTRVHPADKGKGSYNRKPNYGPTTEREEIEALYEHGGLGHTEIGHDPQP